jgi:hypothetical protein
MASAHRLWYCARPANAPICPQADEGAPMKILKNIAIVLFAIFTALYALGTFLPKHDTERLAQTLTFNGKTVHLVLRGEGPISYKTETADGTLIVNGQKLDLSGYP